MWFYMDDPWDHPVDWMCFVGATCRMFNFMNIFYMMCHDLKLQKHDILFLKRKTRNLTRVRFGRWFLVFPVCAHHQVFSNYRILLKEATGSAKIHPRYWPVNICTGFVVFTGGISMEAGVNKSGYNLLWSIKKASCWGHSLTYLL